MPKIAGQETSMERIKASLLESKLAKERSAQACKEKAVENPMHLIEKLAQDLAALQEINALVPREDYPPLIKKLNLATPSCSYDNVTLMSTAIADLIHAAQVFTSDGCSPSSGGLRGILTSQYIARRSLAHQFCANNAGGMKDGQHVTGKMQIKGTNFLFGPNYELL
ncbi:hypothetical protein BDN70DRAFT_938230 [Pholiota conissans]|uniref:Uncharacterized protein n=1 Tax=Pholiota conissans TaxID=109636 RepID=A0A9P5YN65_9AGAR|nr:hypothetical protein BDN70DRAFT_938230 [Pholiota conissans]